MNKEELVKFLKENLSLDTKRFSNHDSTCVEIKLVLDEEVISRVWVDL